MARAPGLSSKIDQWPFIDFLLGAAGGDPEGLLSTLPLRGL